VVDYYARRAAAEVSLILSEGTVIEKPSSNNLKDIPDFYSASLAEWRKVVEKVHANGGAMGPQIWHVGQMPYGREPPSPFEHPDNMNLEAIQKTIGAFGRAAGEAKALGFECVEIHGAMVTRLTSLFGKLPTTEPMCLAEKK
jgi:2,4-dienoyl-CoA reductase-like NADH-dependent reductase (Old Yellow Enzyme family)